MKIINSKQYFATAYRPSTKKTTTFVYRSTCLVHFTSFLVHNTWKDIPPTFFLCQVGKIELQLCRKTMSCVKLNEKTNIWTLTRLWPSLLEGHGDLLHKWKPKKGENTTSITSTPLNCWHAFNMFHIWYDHHFIAWYNTKKMKMGEVVYHISLKSIPLDGNNILLSYHMTLQWYQRINI